MILKISISPQALKSEGQSDSWLPAELSPFPPKSSVENKNTSEAITLTICFMRDQYFLKEGNEWVALEKQKQLEMNTSCVMLKPEPIPKSSLFKKPIITARVAKLGSSVSKIFGYANESQPLYESNSSPLSKKDPLDFLRKGTEFNTSKPSLTQLFATSDEE